MLNESAEKKNFLIMSLLTMPAMFLYSFVSDIYYHTHTKADSYEDMIIMIFAMILALVLVIVGMKRKKLGAIPAILAFLQVFVIIPEDISCTEMYMGQSVWYAAGTLYIVALVKGPVKYVLFVLEGLIAMAIQLLFFQERMDGSYTDFFEIAISFVAILMVCIMIVIMVEYQLRKLREAAQKAEEQRREIEELNKAQNRFFSSMSHEIRTPINTIIGLNEMILREDINEEVAEDARNIRSASGILLSLINDILDMSKMESGKMEIVRAAYDTGHMLSEIVNMVLGRATEKGLKFSVDVDPRLPAQLFSDEMRIKQILINLLNNAVKYTKEGEITLSIHCEKTGAGKVQVVYQVADTGVGIRSESIPHLFDAFKRVDEANNHYIEGTGLGLSIVKQLVELLGGEISVSSVYTKGSTFAVSLEHEIVGEEELGRFDTERLHSAGHTKKYHRSFTAPDARILIVDDNSANRMVACKLLRETRMQIDTAQSGEECLKATLQTHYDLILMDHMMPGMDGIQCLHAVREQDGGMCSDTPVIALTANAGGQSKALYRREGFDAYIVKPVEGEALEDAIRSLLPTDLVTLDKGIETQYGANVVLNEAIRKVPLLITSDSVCDLPKEVIRSLRIKLMAYKVITKDGVFFDGTEAKGDALLRYMENDGLEAKSEAPGVEEYEEFFAKQLAGAQHILHIAMAQHSSHGYENACEAAKSFYNVKVIDSGHLSSGMGMVAMDAAKAAEGGQMNTDAIAKWLLEERDKVQTSFIMAGTEYLSRSGRLSMQIHRLCVAFMVHPIIRMKKSSMSIGGILMGNYRNARRRYIQKTLNRPGGVDPSTLFITYAGMDREELEEIRKEVLEQIPFEKVYLKKASPAIAINCGPGTFGLIFKTM